MLNTIRASTHASSARRAFHCLTRSLLPISLARSRPSGVLSKWVEVDKRLFASHPLHLQLAATVLDTPKGLDDVYHTAGNSSERAEDVPLSCPGCGAPGQTIDPEAAGYFGSKRATKQNKRMKKRQEENEAFSNALISGSLDLDAPATNTPVPSEPVQQEQRSKLCERCHYLLYQHRGSGIIHPTTRSIQQIIEESPHRHNHIYHILDAADFPMSVIPDLRQRLHLPRLRTRNRRSKSMHYVRGRTAEVTFLITRSDLLAPKKEQVDSLVPYLREVLRDSLGKSGRNTRLKNVRCVSAHRGWWTPDVKEDIWNRGGAGWMVGKANVGKSALYGVVFPKGRNQVDTDIARMREAEKRVLQGDAAALNGRGESMTFSPFGTDVIRAGNGTQVEESLALEEFESVLERSAGKTQEEEEEMDDEQFDREFLEQERQERLEDELFDTTEDASLLPPAQPETAYPQMPLVSALSGTTASPIRIPFGNGKGELIDLPGIHRSSLDTQIKPEHRKSLVMKSRVVPEQHVLKPGQSLLIGGGIRITPKTDDLIFLAYPFVPLEPHVTSHQKAEAIQTGFNADGEAYDGFVENICTDEAKHSIKSAGVFPLEWDVTKRRTGSLTNKAAGKVRSADLPFVIYSVDILIESVGWIELTCQVRRRQQPSSKSTKNDPFRTTNIVDEETSPVPEVEVFTPQGHFVSSRRPMNAWVLGGPKKPPKYLRHSRPRQSISMAKRRAGAAKNTSNLAQ